MTDLSRRTLMRAAGGLGAVIVPTVVPATGANATDHTTPDASAVRAEASHEMPPTTYLFFNSEEAVFIEAAVARLIPAADDWPGAREACVSNFIDKQLAGAWGAGERLYRSGPWQPGTASQGYQLPYTPAELFRTALAALNKQLGHTPFASMSTEDQDNYLKKLEAGGQDLGGVPSEVFFAHLWECTLEGFFSDPVYGGNCNMVSWRMVGFPGAYASYYDLVDKHGIKIDRAPMSLAEDVHGHVHTDPGIPARSP